MFLTFLFINSQNLSLENSAGKMIMGPYLTSKWVQMSHISSTVKRGTPKHGLCACVKCQTFHINRHGLQELSLPTNQSRGCVLSAVGIKS